MKHQLIKTPAGSIISLYRLANKPSTGLPLIITHGTISNGETVLALASYLQEKGFDCWVLEWGGHGHSVTAHRNQNFEAPAFYDLPSAVETVLQQTGKAKVYWVSHSGGGHLPLMHLARHPDQQKYFAGLVSLGAQATHGALGFKYKLRAAALWAITHSLGRTPKALASVGTEGEPSKLLAQWAVWNIKRKWIGSDGFDYLPALSKIHVPVLTIAGQADDIAPPDGCRLFHDSLGSDDKDWLLCSNRLGFSKDFTHGQLIRGRAAEQEIYPHVYRWIAHRNGTATAA